MFRKKKKAEEVLEQTKPEEKPTPAFLREEYPYKAVGGAIENLDELDPGAVYEIKCQECEMSIRSQGVNIKGTMERLKESGCIGCGNKKLLVRRVDMRSGVSV